MPLYDSLSTKLSKDWNAPDGKQELNQYLKEGVKLNKFSDGKNAIDQVLLRNSTFNNAQNWASNYGDRVFYEAYYDEKGEPIIAPISDQDGGISLPDQFGRHRRVNGTWIDREYETHIAVEKRVDPTNEMVYHIR